MKLRSLPQREGPFPPFVGNTVALGKPGLNLGGVVEVTIKMIVKIEPEVFIRDVTDAEICGVSEVSGFITNCCSLQDVSRRAIDANMPT